MGHPVSQSYWRNELPSCEGYYWWRESPEEDSKFWTILEIYLDDDGVLMVDTGDFECVKLVEWDEGQWSSLPISKPVERK